MNSHNRSRKTSTPILKSTRLLDQLREQIRHLHYAFAPKKRTFIGVKKFTPLARKRCEMLVRRIEQVFPAWPTPARPSRAATLSSGAPCARPPQPIFP